MTSIPFNIPPYVGTEIQYVQEAVDAHKICGDGQFTKKCNAWIEKRFGAVGALLTTSGTTALEMATLLCGLEKGDEVILPSFTFSSTATSIVLTGATPVFIDIRPDTMNIDETKIEEAITDKTKAIMAVHYAGVSCEMDTIMEIARRHGLKVIEDAAQGVMSTYKKEYTCQCRRCEFNPWVGKIHWRRKLPPQYFVFRSSHSSILAWEIP